MKFWLIKNLGLNPNPHSAKSMDSIQIESGSTTLDQSAYKQGYTDSIITNYKLQANLCNNWASATATRNAPDRKSRNNKVYILSGPDRHQMHLANRCCGAEMVIADPGSWFSPSWIPDPKTRTNFDSCKLFYFWKGTEKNELLEKNFSTFYFFIQKIVTKLPEILVGVSRSGKNLTRMSNPRGSKKHQIRLRNTAQTNFRLAYLCDRMREIRMVSRFWYRMFQIKPYFRLGRCKFAARHRPLETLNNLPSPDITI